MEKRLNRTGLMGGQECPNYQKYATFNEKARKVYCEAVCPFEKGSVMKLKGPDLKYQECTTKGFITQDELNSFKKHLPKKNLAELATY